MLQTKKLHYAGYICDELLTLCGLKATSTATTTTTTRNTRAIPMTMNKDSRSGRRQNRRVIRGGGVVGSEESGGNEGDERALQLRVGQ